MRRERQPGAGKLGKEKKKERGGHSVEEGLSFEENASQVELKVRVESKNLLNGWEKGKA